jgi:hypothetical protein
MSSRQKEGLKKVLLKGAMSAGYATELWTLPRIAEQIQRRYGIVYHPGHVWRLLVDMGWSCQKPERCALQRDEEAIEQWKRVDWPRIKKRAKTWRPSGLPRRKRLFAHPQRSQNLGSSRPNSHSPA